jgi:phage-related protein
LTYVESDIYGVGAFCGTGRTKSVEAMAKKPSTREARAAESKRDKPLAWLAGEIKTPPLSSEARQEAGVLLRRLQRGESLSLPESRPMPSIGPRCHELRIDDVQLKKEWRVIYYVGRHAIAVLRCSRRPPGPRRTA